MFSDMQVSINPNVTPNVPPDSNLPSTNPYTGGLTVAVGTGAVFLILLISAIGYRSYRRIRLRQKIKYLERLWQIENLLP